VLSFGSSAEVLEPLWLREEMIQIAMKWDQLYNSER
jgi:predicted DNA-binding transcriptional regulator YafY